MPISKKSARQRFLNAATACTVTGVICLIVFVIQIAIVHFQYGFAFDLSLIWDMFIRTIGWLWAWPAIIYISLRWVIRRGHAWAVITALSLVSLHALGILLLMILSLSIEPELFTLLLGLSTLGILTMSIVFLARCIPALRTANGGPRGFAVVPLGAPLGNPIPPSPSSYPLPPAALSQRVPPQPARPNDQQMIELD